MRNVFRSHLCLESHKSQTQLESPTCVSQVSQVSNSARVSHVSQVSLKSLTCVAMGQLFSSLSACCCRNLDGVVANGLVPHADGHVSALGHAACILATPKAKASPCRRPHPAACARSDPKRIQGEEVPPPPPSPVLILVVPDDRRRPCGGCPAACASTARPSAAPPGGVHHLTIFPISPIGPHKRARTVPTPH